MDIQIDPIYIDHIIIIIIIIIMRLEFALYRHSFVYGDIHPSSPRYFQVLIGRYFPPLSSVKPPCIHHHPIH